MKGCKECGGRAEFSTGIDGSITAGWGKLDDLGYWEHTCRSCALHANASEAMRLRDELEKTKQLLSDRDGWWDEFFAACAHMGVVSDHRLDSKAPSYQVAVGIVQYLKAQLDRSTEWNNRYGGAIRRALRALDGLGNRCPLGVSDAICLLERALAGEDPPAMILPEYSCKPKEG